MVFDARIQSSTKILQNEELDALFVTANSNIFYLSGLSEFPPNERDCRILITKKNAYLFTDFRYAEAVTQKAPFLTLVEISYNNSLIQALDKIIKKEKLQNIGIEGGSLTVNEHAALSTNFPSQDFKPVENLIEQLRTLKDDPELKLLEKACQLTDAAFDFIVRHVKSGVSEKKLAWEIEKYIKEHTCETAFPSIVAFGAHAAIPHHSPTDKILSARDEIVLLDFGAKIDGYASDMTRTFFVKNPAQETKDAYTALLEIQKDAIKHLGEYKKNNFVTSSLHKNVDLALKELGYPPVPHALGHGVGIDVHEAPILSAYSETTIGPNMVVTIEPGIYIPGKFGMRIEDTVVLNESAQPLTRSRKDFFVLPLTD